MNCARTLVITISSFAIACGRLAGDNCPDCYGDPEQVVAKVDPYPILSGNTILMGKLVDDPYAGGMRRSGLPFRWGYLTTYEGTVACGGFAGDCLYQDMKLISAVPTVTAGVTFDLRVYGAGLRDALGATNNAQSPDCATGLSLTAKTEDEHRVVKLRFETPEACRQFVQMFITAPTGSPQRVTFEFVSPPPINELLVKSVAVDTWHSRE